MEIELRNGGQRLGHGCIFPTQRGRCDRLIEHTPGLRFDDLDMGDRAVGRNAQANAHMTLGHAVTDRVARKARLLPCDES